MQRKICAKPVYLSGRNKSDREFIYLHMSNHYKRIVNAKKAIDNSPPTCFKGKRPCTSNPGIPKNKANRHFESLLLTDRSLSTNSNRDSWGTDSFTCGSRYHARCVPDASNVTSPKLGDMDLIERITFDTKHGPASYSEKCWSKPKEHCEKRIVLKENKSEVKHSPGKRSLSNAGHSERTQKRKLNSQKALKSSEVPAKGTKSIPSGREKLAAKVLKRPAVSKLRSLRVYHPPRRVEPRPKTANSRSYCKCTKICLCDESGCVNESASKKMTLNPKEHSVTSSRDSAYNGGISSVPESRSPTPDHRSKKDCCCCCCERMQRASMLFPKERSNTTTPRATTPRATTPRGRSPRSRSPRARSATPKSDVRPKSATGPRPAMAHKSATKLKSAMGPKSAKAALKASIKTPISGSDTSLSKSTCKSRDRDPYEKMQDDALYVSFVQDITTEVLEKNLYTNKALKNVMKKHLQKNLKRLDKDRMLQELEHLRMQLGIPEDQSLFDSAIETVDSTCDMTKFNYPIISDSEFSFPVEDILTPEKTRSPEKIKAPDKTKTSEKAKVSEKGKMLERSKSPDKMKPKPMDAAKMAEEATTCLFIKPAADSLVLQATRIKAAREPPLCSELKTAYAQQPCGQTASCFKAVTQSSGPAPCFLAQSAAHVTSCCLPQSSTHTTSSFLPQSGQASPSFMQQSSGQATPSYIQHSPTHGTLSFVQQSPPYGTPTFIPQSPTYGTPSFMAQSPSQGTPSQPQSSAQTPSFTPQPSVVLVPSYIPQKSGQSKSLGPALSRQATLSFQQPTILTKPSIQAAPPLLAKPSVIASPSLLAIPSVQIAPSSPAKPSIQAAPSILAKPSMQTAPSVLAKSSAHPSPSIVAKPSSQIAPSVLTKSSTQTAPSILTKSSTQARSDLTEPSILTAPSFLPSTTMQTKVFLKQTVRQASVHTEQVPAVDSRGRTSVSTEMFRTQGEKSATIIESLKNSSETDNEISGIPKKKSPRDRRKEDSILKNSATRSREMSSEDSDRPSEPKKRSYGKSRRQKFPKRVTISSSDSELSGCYSKTLLKENRRVSASKDTYSAGSSTPTHVRKKSRSVSFWRNPEYKTYHGPKIKTRKTVVSHSEESFVVARKKSPKCE